LVRQNEYRRSNGQNGTAITGGRADRYVSCYLSTDLFRRELRSPILTVNTQTAPIRVRTDLRLSNEDGSKVNLERPKVLFNKRTRKFVLWAHYENGKDYRAAACAIATSDHPDEGFVYHGNFNPYGCMSRDCTLFQDDDGSAYFISAARDNADLHMYRLAGEYLKCRPLGTQAVARRVSRSSGGVQAERTLLYAVFVLHRLGAESGQIRRRRHDRRGLEPARRFRRLHHVRHATRIRPETFRKRVPLRFGSMECAGIRPIRLCDPSDSF